LLNYSDFIYEDVFCCFTSDILRAIQNVLGNSCVFFDPQLALKCPHVLSLLKPSYLCSLIELRLEHANNNPEETNVYLNRAFEEATGIKDIQVLRAKYLNISFDFIKQPTMKNSLGKMFHGSRLIWNDIRFGIFNKELVICAKNEKNPNNIAVYCMALKCLLKSLNPHKDDDQLAEQARNVLTNMPKEHLNHNNWKTSEYAFGNANIFNLNDVIFQQDNNDSSQFNEAYFIGNDDPAVGPIDGCSSTSNNNRNIIYFISSQNISLHPSTFTRM